MDTVYDMDAAGSTDVASVRAWLSRFGDCVGEVDFASARALFAADVVGFGTWAEVLRGLDDLEALQWRKVWPTIDAFAFDVSGADVLVSPDGLLAAVVAGWTSIGTGEDGSTFDRPGRATIVVRRSTPMDPWQGVHTHFSLARDVPQRSYRTT